MQSSVRKEKTSISPGSTTVFPHAKQGKHKHRQTSPVTLMCCVCPATQTQSHKKNGHQHNRNASAFQMRPDRVTWPPLSSLPCQPSSSWPSPSSSSSCFIYLRPNQAVTVRPTDTNLSSRFSAFFKMYYLYFITALLPLCSMLFWTSGQICGSSDQQAGGQERRPW